MALFDTLIAELSKHFNLGGRAAALVAETLRSMTGDNIGGLGGFLDKFKHAGLGEVVASWLGQGPTRDLQPAQIEAVLGSGFLANIARRVGLDTSFLAAPVAFSVPRIVDLLTPAGEVPATLPAEAQALLAATPAAAAGAHAAPAKTATARFWWFPALVALIAIAAYFAWQTPTQRGTHPAQPAMAPAPIAKTPATLSITNTDGQVRYGGKVADETTRDQVEAALKQAFGDGNLRGTLSIDPGTEAAAWLAKLSTALNALNIPGVEAVFEGKNIFVGGLADADLAALQERLKSIFGADFSFASLLDRVSAAIANARAQTLSALATLKAGFTGPDLVKALNFAIINFETGSANVTADARALLERVAASMKAAPETTIIEIAGHTDTTGDAATNQTLSEQRAQTVRSILVESGVPETVVIAKGYGDTRPIASNDTPDGRFQNRRIEFIVLN
jgi:Outer membrane protein and related peptidoglycan-associated (lipo)proteins